MITRDLRPLAAPCLLAAALALAACSDGTQPVPDAGDDVVSPDDVAPDPTDATDDAAPADTGPPPLMRFGVIGDIRPPTQDATAQYPSGILRSVMTGLAQQGPAFVVATGDYMYASNATVANAQVDLLSAGEQNFAGHVYHAMGNHECTSGTTSNCPNGTEGNAGTYRSRLAEANSVYFDWTIPTPMGDAHFIATAPNAWSTSQSAWLDRALAQQAAYTIVISHIPPSAPGPTSVMEIESKIAARAGGVSLRLYGHTHDYRRISGTTNAVIVGNAGAPLAGAGSAYGFVVVDQQTDGTLDVTSYEIGNPPMVVETFRVAPDGTQR